MDRGLIERDEVFHGSTYHHRKGRKHWLCQGLHAAIRTLQRKEKEPWDPGPVSCQGFSQIIKFGADLVESLCLSFCSLFLAFASRVFPFRHLNAKLINVFGMKRVGRVVEASHCAITIRRL